MTGGTLKRVTSSMGMGRSNTICWEMRCSTCLCRPRLPCQQQEMASSTSRAHNKLVSLLMHPWNAPIMQQAPASELPPDYASVLPMIKSTEFRMVFNHSLCQSLQISSCLCASCRYW